jgi:hypothetical protein
MVSVGWFLSVIKRLCFPVYFAELFLILSVVYFD